MTNHLKNSIWEWVSSLEEPQVKIGDAAAKFGYTYAVVYNCFQAFDAERRGRLIIGRRGKPTRFEFYKEGNISQKDNILKEENSVYKNLEAPLGRDLGSLEQAQQANEKNYEPLLHSFALRPDLQIEIQLPSDLRPNEAERLASFIKTLPFS